MDKPISVSRKALIEKLKHETYLAKMTRTPYSEGTLFLADVLEVWLKSQSSTESEGEAARLREALKKIMDEVAKHTTEDFSDHIHMIGTRALIFSTSETAVQQTNKNGLTEYIACPIRDNCSSFNAPGQFACSCDPGTCRDAGIPGIKDGRDTE